MACDSKTTTGSTWYDGGSKIERIDGALCGGAGDVLAIAKIMKWLRGGRKAVQPKFKRAEDASVLILGGDGLALAFLSCREICIDPIKSPYFALGSGDQLALLAMDLGMTPEQAVKAACKRDENSALPIHVERLKGKHAG